ncbi:hypothetical protein [Streptomyces sp. NPDC097619]|uniref:hypothetical protein n=1 Tax=Streptomyces sp. NPDC097619 TaxID=3157228 RepID=UPI003318FBE5
MPEGAAAAPPPGPVPLDDVSAALVEFVPWAFGADDLTLAVERPDGTRSLHFFEDEESAHAHMRECGLAEGWERCALVRHGTLEPAAGGEAVPAVHLELHDRDRAFGARLARAFGSEAVAFTGDAQSVLWESAAPGEALAELVDFARDLVVEGPELVYVLADDMDDRYLYEFPDEEAAYAHARDGSHGYLRCAVALAAALGVNGHTTDGILVHAHELGAPSGWHWLQRYEGDPVRLDGFEPLLTGAGGGGGVHHPDRYEILFEGDAEGGLALSLPLGESGVPRLEELTALIERALTIEAETGHRAYDPQLGAYLGDMGRAP